MKQSLLLLSGILCSYILHAQNLLNADFNNGVPATWTIQDGGTTTDTWFGTTGGYNGNYLDGTEFVFVDSDAAGNNNDTLSEGLVTPSINTAGSQALYLEFDHFYNMYTTADTGYLEVFDGAQWVTLLQYFDQDFGGWNAPEHVVVNLTPYANANLRVRWRYEDYGTWAWYWAVDNVEIYQLLPEDAGIISVLAPVSACQFLTNEQVVVEVHNFGLDTIFSTDVNYTLNGGPTTTETINQTIAPGDTLLYTFTQTANLQSPGPHTINAWTTLANDGDPSNDALIKVVDNAHLSTFPYAIDFETGQGGWTSSGANNSWQFGTPNAGFIQDAASGQNAWVTNLTGNHNNNELAFLTSPCFDFSGLAADPTLQFSLMYEIEVNYDNAWVEVSTDGGQNFTKVGTAGTGLEWYNDVNDDAWEGTSGNAGEWVVAEQLLAGTAGESSVQIRFVFESDFSVINEGIGIDDIEITPPPANDLGVITLISPTDGCGDGSSEVVTIQIYNYGSSAQNGFEVVYQIDGGVPVYEQVNTTLNFMDTLTYSFTNLANMGGAGNHTVTVATNLFGDQNNINNALYNVPVTNSGPTPWSQAISDSLPISFSNPEGLSSPQIFCGMPEELGPCFFIESLTIDSLHHPVMGEVSIYLISPDGDTLNVSSNNGAIGTGYYNVIFSDTSSNDITASFSGINPGIYYPEDPAGFGLFDGQNPNGQWTLWIDDNLPLEDGTLYEWSLNFAAAPALDLGADTLICDFDSLTFDGGSFDSYLWQDGSTTPQFVMDATQFPLGTEWIALTVTDSNGCEATDSLLVEIELCTGIEANAATSGMTLYPNPTQNQFWVKSAIAGPLHVEVVDLTGRLVLNPTMIENGGSIDLSDEVPGIYQVIVTQGNQRMVTRLVKL